MVNPGTLAIRAAVVAVAIPTTAIATPAERNRLGGNGLRCAGPVAVLLLTGGAWFAADTPSSSRDCHRIGRVRSLNVELWRTDSTPLTLGNSPWRRRNCRSRNGRIFEPRTVHLRVRANGPRVETVRINVCQRCASRARGQNLQIDRGTSLAGQYVTIATSKARRILQVKRWVTKSRTPRNAGPDGNALLAISRLHVRDFKRVMCS